MNGVKVCAIAFLSVAFIIAGTGLMGGSPMMLLTSSTPAHIAANYIQNRQSILLFTVIMALSAMFWGLFVAVVAVAMMRMQPRSFLLIFIHLLFGLIAVLLPFFGAIFFTAAAFRPTLSPDVIAALQDTGKFFLLGSMPTLFGALALAIAIFGDRSAEPILPKWLAWVNVVYAVGIQTNVLALFFSSGPLGLDGSIGMLLPLILVELYVVLTAIAMYRIKPVLWAQADTLVPVKEYGGTV